MPKKSNTTKIQFMPQWHVPGCIHVFSGTEWTYGEVKEFDNDEKVRILIDGVPVYVNVVEDILSNTNFRIADGVNPNFTCSKCGKETLAEARLHDKNPDVVVPFEIDGKKVCPECFEAAPKIIHPDSIEIIQEN